VQKRAIIGNKTSLIAAHLGALNQGEGEFCLSGTGFSHQHDTASLQLNSCCMEAAFFLFGCHV
jgi:hypothetical protein